jgi:hypothetical protein
VYPQAYRELLARLGADAVREDEVMHYARLPEGHSYGGWVHVVGELLAGPDAYVPSQTGNGFEVKLEPLGAGFSVGVSRHTSLVPEPFRGLPLLAVEFSALAPWVLAEPELD